MAFVLQPVTPDDTADITRLVQSAFANDHIIRHFYPHTPESVKWEQDFRFYSTFIVDCVAYGGRMTKVVEVGSGFVLPFFLLVT